MNRTLTMKTYSLLALVALLIALPAIAEIPLESIRVTQPVELRSEGHTVTLDAHAAVDEGDRIITGSGGRVSLQFAQQSMMTLGQNSELYIHSADPPDIGQGAVMRMQLTHGDLQVDARSTERAPPQDFRINVGTLSVRILGGHLWATADDAGETLCLLDGAAEINNGDERHRLDGINDCLGHRLDSKEVHIMANSPEVIQGLLARTSFDSTMNAAASVSPEHMAMAPSKQSRAPTQRPTPVQTAKADMPSAKPTIKSAPALNSGEWTVVVASLSDEHAAEQMKKKLAREGLHSSLQPSASDPTRHQVIIGTYKTQNEARLAATKLKKQARFKGAWPTTRHAED